MLIEATSQIASRITGAIRDAARVTGTSFDYLLKTAQRESNLDPNAKASTSSATGLFQFIDQTWLGTLKRDGAALGYGQYADAVVQTQSGRFIVPDPAQRKAVMNLRTDPAAASAMAGAFTERNAAVLQNRLGREPSDGELYIAHFLGPTGAVRLISSAEAAPNAKAAALFPHAARANRSIFYDRAGAARSLSQVYASLISKHENTKSPIAVAAASAAPLPPPAHAPAVASASEVSAAARTSPAKLAIPAAYAAEGRPVFYGLFRSEGREPVSLVVSEAWSAERVPQRRARAAKIAQAAAAPIATNANPGPLRLFEFLRPEIKARSGA